MRSVGTKDQVLPKEREVTGYKKFGKVIDSILRSMSENNDNGTPRTIDFIYSMLARKFNAQALLEKRRELSSDGNGDGVKLPRCLFGEGIGFFGSHNPYTGQSKDKEEVRHVLSELFGVDFSKKRVIDSQASELTAYIRNIAIEQVANDVPIVVSGIQHLLAYISGQMKKIHSKDIRQSISDIQLNSDDFIVGDDGKVRFSQTGDTKLFSCQEEHIPDILRGYLANFNDKK